MNESEYKRLHEKEASELRLYETKHGCDSERYGGISDKPIKANYPTKHRVPFFAGMLALSTGFAISSSFFLLGYYIGRNDRREESIKEIGRMQKEKKIMILNKKEMEKMNKDLEEVIDNERERYFIKGVSSTK